MKDSTAVKQDIDFRRYCAKEGVDPLSQAFDGKITTHSGLSSEQIEESAIQDALADLLNQERKDRTSAYIHVPFCETHCLYCGFYNKPYRKAESSIFADTLIKEIEMWEGKTAVTSAPINALYFGGGTPTALEPVDMKRILATIRCALPLANDCEITVEGRISNISQEKAEAYLEGGVNRFSLGVQSFNTDIRRAMGRRSSREEIIKTLEMLKGYNQGAIVLDLIYGFPNQTMEIWRDDVETAISLDLDGFDCYQLNVFGFTPLGERIAEGKIAPASDIAAKSAMFAESINILQSAFYSRLSINHWARTTRERNIYNQLARGNASCLAFGPGAGGNINGYGFMVQRNYDSWRNAVLSGVKPIMAMTVPDKNHRLFKSVSEEMETGRLDIAKLESRFGLPLLSIWHDILSQWQKAGLITFENGKIILTTAGQFWYVNLSQLLLEYLRLTINEDNGGN